MTATPARRRPPAVLDELSRLANIGPAMRRDLALLGIDTIADLARQDADDLYLRLQRVSHSDQDPCVWDTFAAAIHQARTGQPSRWWDWTPIRKERMAAGQFKRRP